MCRLMEGSRSFSEELGMRDDWYIWYRFLIDLRLLRAIVCNIQCE